MAVLPVVVMLTPDTFSVVVATTLSLIANLFVGSDGVVLEHAHNADVNSSAPRAITAHIVLFIF